MRLVLLAAFVGGAAAAVLTEREVTKLGGDLGTYYSWVNYKTVAQQYYNDCTGISASTSSPRYCSEATSDNKKCGVRPWDASSTTRCVDTGGNVVCSLTSGGSCQSVASGFNWTAGEWATISTGSAATPCKFCPYCVMPSTTATPSDWNYYCNPGAGQLLGTSICPLRAAVTAGGGTFPPSPLDVMGAIQSATQECDHQTTYTMAGVASAASAVSRYDHLTGCYNPSELKLKINTDGTSTGRPDSTTDGTDTLGDYTVADLYYATGQLRQTSTIDTFVAYPVSAQASFNVQNTTCTTFVHGMHNAGSMTVNSHPTFGHAVFTDLTNEAGSAYPVQFTGGTVTILGGIHRGQAGITMSTDKSVTIYGLTNSAKITFTSSQDVFVGNLQNEQPGTIEATGVVFQGSDIANDGTITITSSRGRIVDLRNSAFGTVTVTNSLAPTSDASNDGLYVGVTSNAGRIVVEGGTVSRLYIEYNSGTIELKGSLRLTEIVVLENTGTITVASAVGGVNAAGTEKLTTLFTLGQQGTVTFKADTTNTGQSCSLAASTFACTAPAVKLAAGTCAGAACASVDFGAGSTACCTTIQPTTTTGYYTRSLSSSSYGSAVEQQINFRNICPSAFTSRVKTALVGLITDKLGSLIDGSWQVRVREVAFNPTTTTACTSTSETTLKYWVIFMANAFATDADADAAISLVKAELDQTTTDALTDEALRALVKHTSGTSAVSATKNSAGPAAFTSLTIPQADGSDCVIAAECTNGYCNQEQKCASKVANGQACTYNADCTSTYCTNGLCTTVPCRPTGTNGEALTGGAIELCAARSEDVDPEKFDIICANPSSCTAPECCRANFTNTAATESESDDFIWLAVLIIVFLVIIAIGVAGYIFIEYNRDPELEEEERLLEEAAKKRRETIRRKSKMLQASIMKTERRNSMALLSAMGASGKKGVYAAGAMGDIEERIARLDRVESDLIRIEDRLDLETAILRIEAKVEGTYDPENPPKPPMHPNRQGALSHPREHDRALALQQQVLEDAAPAAYTGAGAVAEDSTDIFAESKNEPKPREPSFDAAAEKEKQRELVKEMREEAYTPHQHHPPGLEEHNSNRNLTSVPADSAADGIEMQEQAAASRKSSAAELNSMIEEGGDL